MYLKVIVMEMTEKYALAMTDEGRVIRIQKKPGMNIGDCIYVLDEDLYDQNKDEGIVGGHHDKIIVFPQKTDHSMTPRHHKRMWRQLTAVAAALLILVMGISFYGESDKAYAMVSLDGKHSVQLTITEKNTVTQAVSLDGSLTEDQLEALIGRNLDELDDYFEEYGLDEDHPVVGYAFLDDESLEEEDALRLQLELMYGKYNVVCVAGKPEDIRAAQQYRKSLGKYLEEKLKAEGEWPEPDDEDDETSEGQEHTMNRPDANSDKYDKKPGRFEYEDDERKEDMELEDFEDRESDEAEISDGDEEQEPLKEEEP